VERYDGLAMAKRGRPRHPDILTPREWEVLALLREGLTNDQIAQRLAISERTAKFHVSEILSKLGVSSRQQAASWSPGQRRPWWAVVLTPFAALRRAPAWAPAVLASALLLAVVLGAGLVAAGLARTSGAPAPQPVVAQPTITPAGPVPVNVVARAPERYVVVYSRPISDLPMNADVQARTIDARTQTVVEDRHLEGVLGGEPLPFYGAGAPAPAFVAYRYGTTRPLDVQSAIMSFGDPPVARQQWEGMPPLLGGVDAAGVVYRQEASGIVARDGSGQIVATYDVPTPIPARPQDLLLDGRPVKGPISMNAGSVSAILVAGNGHPLAFAEGAAHSLVSDLVTGERLDFLQRNRVVAATLGSDGHAYAVLWNQWSGRHDFEVVKINPDAMRIVARHDFDYAGLLNGHGALATPDSGVYFYLPSFAGESLLYQIDPATAAPTPIPLPPRLGLNAAVGVDGNLYFYGGFGENRVSVYDPSTGQLQQDVSWLRAPAGTYVQAVFVS
jgi:DNA-binding CsgD family transcriptional regulator